MTVSGISSFKETMVRLRDERKGAMRVPGERQLKVTILGGGPAGLIRAIESIMDNHRTTVIERRLKDEGSLNGRPNTVALNLHTMPILQKYGIYQWMHENGKVYTYDEETRPYLSVRLKDLESAMKAVLKEIAPRKRIIRYGDTVEEVSQAQTRAAIKLGTGVWINDIDILVNAEGAHSSTNEKLGIGRNQVIAKVPAVAAIFEETRPRITGICTFFEYVGETIVETGVSVYYYAIFFFKFIFQGERFHNADRMIVGSLILKTPGQNYVGCGFSKTHTDELLALHHKVEVIRAEVETPEKQARLAEAEAEFNSFANYWMNLSFCKANLLAFLIKIAKCFGSHEDVPLETAGRFPLKNFKVVEIGADKAETAQKRLRSSAYLICGDALATVDPTTGLGANTAIGTVEYFKDVMTGMKQNANLDLLLTTYEGSSRTKIADIHHQCRRMRNLFRPDTLQ